MGKAENQAAASRRLFAWRDGDATDHIRWLETALSECQHDLLWLGETKEEPSDTDVLVLFLVTESLDRTEPIINELVNAWRGTVVPLALEGEIGREDAPEEVRNIRWAYYGRGNTEILSIVIATTEAPPEWFTSYNDLVARTRAPTSDGWLPRGYLNRSEIDSARTLMLRCPPSLQQSVPGELGAFLEQSKRACRRRTQAWAALSLGVLLVLGSISLIAFHNRTQANTAERMHQRASAAATGRLLAQLSGDYLGKDPDLPILLAQRAYRLDPGGATYQALRSAIDAAPIHHSIWLGSRVTAIASSPQTSNAVVYERPGRLELVSLTSFRIEDEIPVPQARGTPSIAIAPDGSSVALAYPGGLVQVRSAKDNLLLRQTFRLDQAKRATPLDLTWLGANSLLTAWSGLPALRIPLSGGQPTSLDLGFGSIATFAVSPDGHFAALANQSAIAVLNTSDWQPCMASIHTGSSSASSLALTANYVVAARSGSTALVQELPAACGGSGSATSSPWPWDQNSGAAIALPDGTVAFATTLGTVVLMNPVSADPSQTFLAGSGSVTTLGSAPHNQLVSYGADGWLRLWSLTRPPEFPVGSTPYDAITEGYVSATSIQTWRNLLAISANGHQVMVGNMASGTLSVLADTGSALRLNEQWFVDIDASIRPSTQANECDALLLNIGGALDNVQCTGKTLTTIWKRSNPLTDPTDVNTALSSDNQYIGLSSLNEVESVNVQTNHRNVLYSASPIKSIGFDDADDLVAIETNGDLLSISKTGTTRTTSVQNAGSVLGGTVTPNGKSVLLMNEDNTVILAKRANGAVVSTDAIPGASNAYLDVRMNPGGSLALIVSQSGYAVMTVNDLRVIASGSAADTDDPATALSDGAFLPHSASLLLLRQDGGIATVNLARWRFDRGQPLLSATNPLMPRSLRPSELSGLLATGRPA